MFRSSIENRTNIVNTLYDYGISLLKVQYPVEYEEGDTLRNIHVRSIRRLDASLLYIWFKSFRSLRILHKMGQTLKQASERTFRIMVCILRMGHVLQRGSILKNGPILLGVSFKWVISSEWVMSFQ